MEPDVSIWRQKVVNDLRERYGPWALVTGSSAGIGKAFSERLAAEHFNLILVARNATRLKEQAGLLERTHGIRCLHLSCDLTRHEDLERLLERTGNVDLGLFVNNAGASSHHGHFIDRPWSQIEKLVEFNTQVQLRLLHYFACHLARRGRGGIIQVGSIAGHMSVPYMVEYSASKAFQLAAGEALSYELSERGVDVLVLSPGATRSERVDYGMDAADVVNSGLTALGRRPSLVPGWHNRFSSLRFRFLNTRARALARMGRFQRTRLVQGPAD
ncbi:SDR family NAD(P)-dependent oxidoreductase [Haliea sp. E1-2-M8]|nr:SDR family NAD(P)-dependent oxidoreductase [Haliea sp. E1-2-M8]MDO8863152.1 SDR family NAD(P)-dependent oxidoreductase [Haliea sp. E1-2-M8]